MKLICHRANLNGVESSLENKPEQIDKCINLGYNVEVDMRYDSSTKIFYLGHDKPQYKVNLKWIENRYQYLWIHCKDIHCLYEFLKYPDIQYQYFWHQEDSFTLTSNNFIWTYPGKQYTSKSIIVMPEWNTKLNDFKSLKLINCYGICTDYVAYLK